MLRMGLKRAIRDETGNVTVETVLWLPVYMFLLTLVFDSSMVFFNQSNILRAMQDANRAYAIGQIHSLADTENAIRDSVAVMGAKAKVSSVQVGPMLRSQVTVRAGDLSGVGLLRRIGNIEFTLASQHFVEG